jgi:hypothetical protein
LELIELTDGMKAWLSEERRPPMLAKDAPSSPWKMS